MNGAPPPDERHAIGERSAKKPDRFEHVRQRFTRLEAAQPIHVAGAPDRMRNRGSFALDEIEIEPHRGEGNQKVREQDCGVDVDDVHGLQRDRHREFGRSADVEQGVALPQGPVVGHVTPGLAHEPDRRHVNRLPPAGLQESIVHAETRVLARAIRSSNQRGLKRMDAPRDFNSCWIDSARK